MTSYSKAYLNSSKFGERRKRPPASFNSTTFCYEKSFIGHLHIENLHLYETTWHADARIWPTGKTCDCAVGVISTFYLCRYLNLLLSFVFQTLWDACCQTEVSEWSSPVVSVYDVMENYKWFYWINRVPVSWRCNSVISYNLYTCFTLDCSRLTIGFITKLAFMKCNILIDIFNYYKYVF